MHRKVNLFWLIFLFLFLVSFAKAATNPGDNPLIVINGIEYSSDDFGHWWKSIQKEGDPFPDTPDKFIDWHLLAQEAHKMELNTLPSFQHKVDVFVKVRSLMMLKYEEVDSKITVSEQEIRQWYNKEFVPNRYIAELHFDDLKVAEDTLIQLKENKPGYADLHKYAGSGTTPYFLVKHPKWLPPALLPDEIEKDLIGFDHIAFSRPFKAQDGFIIYQQLKIKEEGPHDFEGKKESISKKIHKKKQYQLTEELIKKLKIKYNVQINEDLLVSLDLLAPDPKDMDKVLVSSDRSQVDVAYLVSQVKNKSNLLRELRRDKDQQLRFKRQTVNSMISNSLVDWEGMARHYEQKEPFKPVYQFYTQHRMIIELKNRIYKDITVGEPELQAYYQEHIAEFKKPEKVKLTYLQGGQKVIKSLWAESISGSDIIKASKGIDVTLIYGASQEHNFDELSAILQKKVAPLGKGETSTPFKVEGKYSLVRLEGKTPSFVMPFEMVKQEVQGKMMKLKQEIALEKLLKQLRSSAAIDIDRAVWDKTLANLKNEKKLFSITP